MPVGDNHPVNIVVEGSAIKQTVTHNRRKMSGGLFFTDAVAFPGLINSHDHLDFNCYTPLGKKTYNNYTAWGRDIHHTYKATINSVLNIPLPLRAAWGMYKNLLAGVTTVVHHGVALKIKDPLINIHQQSQSLHSVAFEKKWKWKLNNPLRKNSYCVMHTGEGIDKAAADEITTLLKWNLLNRKLVGVHGVAMNAAQAKKFAGLVWCPESNKVLLNQHADVSRLQAHTALVFGTDSTLTGSWNIWAHLRLARTLHAMTDAALFATVTSAPASLWKFNNGDLQPGKDADMVVAQTPAGQARWTDFFSIDPEDILLVLQKGRIRLFDKVLLPQLIDLGVDVSSFHPININGQVKLVAGNLPALAAAIRHHHPGIVFPFEPVTI